MYLANQSPRIVGYEDADHANDEDDCRSFSGYCFFLNDKSAPITYSSKKQSLVAQSMMESETVALSHAAKEALWLRQLCHDLHVFDDPESPITPSIFMINSDSESVLKARIQASSLIFSLSLFHFLSYCLFIVITFHFRRIIYYVSHHEIFLSFFVTIAVCRKGVLDFIE